jgi:hypothetical protein
MMYVSNEMIYVLMLRINTDAYISRSTSADMNVMSNGENNARSVTSS